MQRTLEVGESRDGYVKHKFIRPNTIFEKQYQLDIARECLNANTAVILPTGLGKTIIAFLVMAEFIGKKILFLAPTRPLVQQNHDSILKYMSIGKEDICMLTGHLGANKRKDLWNKKKIIVSTPQTISNDLNNSLYSLDARLIIFDEMHKAVGNYAYVNIAEKADSRILGLTASPGSNRKKVREIMKTLKIEKIEARTRQDPDVSSYVKDIDVKWMSTDLPKEFIEIRNIIKDFYFEKITKMRRIGLLRYKKPEHISKKDLLQVPEYIKKFRGRRKIFAYAAYLNQMQALQAYHSLELLETQGIRPFLKYIDKLKGEKNLKFINAITEAINLSHECRTEHPKIYTMTKEIDLQLKQKPSSLIIIFTQFRSTIEIISEKLDDISVRYERFVGQSSKESKGLSQKQQKEIIKNFKDRKFNVLIATSVAEEGIDIPDVDLVLFYEPIASEIRAIQRKGRTGRSSIGKVLILYTKDTKDEAFLHAQIKKEKKMEKLVRYMSKNL